MKKIKSIPDITLLVDFHKFYDSVGKDSDTLCAILAAGLIDKCLCNAVMRDLSKKGEEFAERASNRTYASKNDLLYASDAINSQLHSDIRSIGGIRNRFAHSQVEVSFSDPDVQEHCNKLSLWEIPNSHFKDEWNKKRNKEKSEICRLKFISSTDVIVRSLLAKGFLHKHAHHQDHKDQ